MTEFAAFFVLLYAKIGFGVAHGVIHWRGFKGESLRDLAIGFLFLSAIWPLVLPIWLVNRIDEILGTDLLGA